MKASIAGAIVTNSLFMLGASFLLGGLRYRTQEYNRAGGRLHAALLLMATIALIMPAAVANLDSPRALGDTKPQHRPRRPADRCLWAGARVLAEDAQGAVRQRGSRRKEAETLPIGVAVGTLIVVTVLVALVSEIFV